MNKLPIYKISLDNSADGISKMSLVEFPAVEQDFLAFTRQESIKFSINEEKRIVFGPAIRADYPIYRISPTIGEYFTVFTKDIIEELYQKFMIEQKFNCVNLEHNSDTNDIYLLQSFIKSSDTGLTPIGFEDCADGSWFVAYKVLNDEVWQGVKSGKFNGFSIEGWFSLDEVKENDELEKLIDDILQ